MTTAHTNELKSSNAFALTPDAHPCRIISIQFARSRRAAHSSTQLEQALAREIERCKLDIHHAENVLNGAKYRLAMTEAGLITRGDIQ